MVLSGNNIIGFCNICNNGLRDNSKDCHRKGCNQDNQDTAYDSGHMEEAGQAGDEEDKAHTKEGENNHFLLGNLLHDDIDRYIADHRKEGHCDVEKGAEALRQFHKNRYVVKKSGLEHGNTDPIADIRNDEDPEFTVGKTLTQRTESIALGRMDFDIVHFLNGQGRNQAADHGDQSHDNENDPHRPDSASYHGCDSGPDGRCHIAQSGTENKGKGDRCRNIRQGLLISGKLGDQCIVRRAVNRHEEIEQKHHDKNPDSIDDSVTTQLRCNRISGCRANIDHDGDQCQRDSGLLHKRNPAALRVFALVRQVADPGVGDGIKDTSQGIDTADNGENAEDHTSLRNEVEHSFGNRDLVRLIKGFNKVGKNGRHQGPAQLSDGKEPDDFFW